jgi:hypothetical protein
MMARVPLGFARWGPGYEEKEGVHFRRHDEIAVETKFCTKKGERKRLGASNHFKKSSPSLNRLRHFVIRDVEGLASSDIEIF